MKLLIITQKVDIDDSNLGFFHGWIMEFAKRCSFLTIVCLEQGRHCLPENVKILSLGKEDRNSRFRYLFLFYKYIWKERHQYDLVFIHMNPEYAIYGGVLWYLLKKKIFLWYTHKNVDWRLRFAEKIVYRIFSASAESFRLDSSKIVITGHGIDTNLFLPAAREETNSEVITILSAGRLSSTKRILEIIQITELISLNMPPCRLLIAGAAVTAADEAYERDIRWYIKERKLDSIVEFIGPIPNVKMPPFYQSAQVVVNFSNTGSLDKALLEAMSCEVPVITTNEAFKLILDPYGLFVKRLDKEILARKVIEAADFELKLKQQLRQEIIRNHSLSNLIGKLFDQFRLIDETSK
jgi:glycosyltransferase involved in cell wall biosynthesis